MKAIQCKLRSRTGASLTFALLLFLVCSIISSVVIVAGTVTSGQLSKLAETDQQYYVVTSAAEMLKDVLEGETVKIVGVTKKTYTATSLDGRNYTSTQTKEDVTASIFFNGANMSPSFLTLGFTDSTNITVPEEFGKHFPTITTNFTLPILADAACRLDGKVVYSADNKTDMKMGFPDLASLNDLAVVDVRKVFQSDGTLKFYVYKTSASSGQTYTLLMTFRPVVDESKNERNSTGVPVTSEDATTHKTIYTREDTKTITTTTTYQWQLTGIQKSQVDLGTVSEPTG